MPWGDAKKGLQTMDAKKKAMIIKCTPPCTIHNTHTHRQLPVSVCFGIRVASHIAIPLRLMEGGARRPSPLRLCLTHYFLKSRCGADMEKTGCSKEEADLEVTEYLKVRET